jgi:hypothetical protein
MNIPVSAPASKMHGLKRTTAELIKLSVVLVCAYLPIVGCGQKLPKIKAPAPQYLYSDMEIQSEQTRSSLTVSAQMPLVELERQLNKAITGLIYEDKSYEDDNRDNLKAKVWKLDDIKVQAKGNYFLFDVPLKIWASAGYKFSPFGYTLEGYRDTEFKMRVRLISEIQFSTDWRLVTRTKVDSYDWITEPSISVAGFAIPIKGMISRMLNNNADKITKAIDEQVRENFQVKDKIQEAWILAQQPYLLSEEFHTWLLNTPDKIEAKLPDARNGNLNIHVGIKGYTQTIVSRQTPMRSKIVKLPPLTIVDNLPQSFQIGLISSISYEDASRMAEGFLKDKTYYFSGNRYSIQIKGIQLYGQSDQLIINASLSGSISGSVYLKGKPTYDPVSQSLFLDELEYDLNTRNVLIRAANWLLHGKFLKMMREAMVFPIGDQLNTLTETVRATLANQPIGEGITLKGKLTNATPDKVHLTPDHIYTIIQATGNLDLRIEKINY